MSQNTNRTTGIAAVVTSVIVAVGAIGYHYIPQPSPALGAADSQPATSVEVGDLVTLNSPGHAVTWVIEPEIPYVAYGPQTENLVTSFKHPGQYYIYAASITEDAGTAVTRYPIAVAGATPATPESKLPFGPKADAPKLAAAFRAVAASVQTRLDNGILVTPEQIISETATANKNALGANAKAWEPYFAKLQAKLQAANLQSMPDHIKVWNELALELEGYSK